LDYLFYHILDILLNKTHQLFTLMNDILNRCLLKKKKWIEYASNEKYECQCQLVPNTRRFLSEHTSLQIPPETSASNLCELLPRPRQPIRTVAYPRVLNRQSRTARQLQMYCLSTTIRARALVTSSIASKSSSDAIMPAARSNSYSRHDLSAMYPGVKSVVWRIDAIPQVGLDGVNQVILISRNMLIIQLEQSKKDSRERYISTDVKKRCIFVGNYINLPELGGNGRSIAYDWIESNITSEITSFDDPNQPILI
jgi:hypothetical protein